MKARHAGPIAGFTLARKVEASFARAVELNPGNVAALNDLGEYYVAAPFIIGGGPDRARALAARMMPRFPAGSAPPAGAPRGRPTTTWPPPNPSSSRPSPPRDRPTPGSTSPSSIRPTRAPTTRWPQSSPAWPPTAPTVPCWWTPPAS